MKFMKLDFIVSRIEAAQDGQPYIYVTYLNPNDYKAGAERSPPFNPFGANMMAFTSWPIWVKRRVEEGFQLILPLSELV